MMLAKGQDRHLMMPTPVLDTHGNTHRLCWLLPDSAPACRVTPDGRAITTKKHKISSLKMPAARSMWASGQLKVMSAIENCRTAALGGHVARCENEKCAYTQIAYNSCRNRHCPKCQGAAAREWLAAREAELLPVPYFHVVFSLPAQIADIAYQNKA